jgi:tetratricopeptide (TPR) repeat protein
LQQNKSSGEAYLLQALLALENKRTIPKTAVADIQRALQLGIKDSQQQAVAHHILGQYYLDREAYTEAGQAFSQVIVLSSGAGNNETRLAEAYRGRSVAYRRQKQYDLAYQDVQQAIKIAERQGNEAQAESLHNELQIIEQHAGRPLSTTSDIHKGGEA